MKYTLRPFQDDAVIGLLDHLERSRAGYQAARIPSAVGLTATTGAGKTVIATALIEAIQHGSERYGVEPDPSAVFLWLTDLPELNLQTQEKMLAGSSDLRLDRLPIIENTFNEEILSAGRVYFLNTQKLSKVTALVKSGPAVKRNFTFWDVVRKTIEDPDITLYLVVDEAHRGMTEARDVNEANSIVQRFIKGYPEGNMPPVPIVLGISATPKRFEDVVAGAGRAVLVHNVPPEDVRASGLIKDKVLAEYAGERQTDALALFPEAVRAWWDATQSWAEYDAKHAGPDDKLVVPALIVQVENEGGGRVTQTDLDAVIRLVADVAGPLPDEAFAHAFGESHPEPVGGQVLRYLEPSRIANDPDARVVFFKTSLGTGWDCPRAEVLFSFRRAVDPTSIAQTIGRMVRTPLTRRITENEDLNSAYVFLPHYNGKAVESIVAYLHASGNEAVADTISKRRESVSLVLRDDATAATKAIAAVPSMLVPTARARSDVSVLASLARFLSSSGIDSDAYTREMRDAAAVLVKRRNELADDKQFAAEVDEEGEVVIQQAELRASETTLTATATKTLPASEESIARIYAIAERKLTGEVAKTYVRLRLGEDPSLLTVARREAYALANRAVAMERLNAHSSARKDELRQQYGPNVKTLTPSQQARYGNILRQASDPSPSEMSLPETAVFPRGEESSYQRHVYADDSGLAPLHFSSSWETDTIATELERQGSVAWLRNVDRANWALTIARREGNTWRPFFPDFLFVREADGGLVVDIVDPHDHTKPDAVSKAKGLSDYARKHAESIVHHVDVLAKIGGQYRRLHLEREAIRKQVDALGDSGKELEQLYLREG